MAAEQMRGARILHLVVVDESGRVVGVLSDRDIRAAQPSVLLVRDPALRNKALSLLKVKDVMSSSAHTVRPDATIRSALTLMKRHRVGSIPVVDDDGHPVGIVTHGNVVALALELLSDLESRSPARSPISLSRE
jgi:acetoin utilization protein AcuB